MKERLPILLIIGTVFALIGAVLNRKSFSESFHNKIYWYISLSVAIPILFIKEYTVQYFIAFSYIGLCIGWILKDIWNKIK